MLESRVEWILGNAIALAIGFVAALQVGMLIEYGFNPELHWNFVPTGQALAAYAAELVSTLALGVVLGGVQASILRSRSIPAFPWLVSTTAGFGLVTVVVWPLMAGRWISQWLNAPRP